MVDDDRELTYEANVAKRGAQYVLSKLQNLMNEGAPSISDLAYTIRLREKEDFKIVAKVKSKRQEKDPTYSVDRIRDIVGLRIVTLYRLDALDVIPRLVALIRGATGAETSLFVSDQFEEIKIFSTNPRGDAQALHQRLVILFQSLGYQDAEIVGIPSNYTSIHLVTWCRGPYMDGFVRVPVEIQIRTALEDAWGEIDHKLKYKPPTQKLTVRDEIALRTSLNHLKVMKTFIDGAAQYADQIRAQADQVTGQRFVATRQRVVKDTSSIIRGMDLKDHIRTQIDHAMEHQIEAMHSLRRSSQYAEARVGSLRNAVRDFTAAIELASVELQAENPARKMLVELYLPLEIALCYFQLGVELKDKTYFAEAVKLYQSVHDKFPDRAIVHYRYARALQKLGDLSAAVSKYREALELLVKGRDTSVEKHHWLRLTVPRNLGVCLWESAEALKLERPKPKDSEANIRTFYLEAYSVTKTAWGMTADPDPLSDRYDLETHYQGRIANNLIYYIEDFLGSGGTTNELKNHGYEEGHLDAYVTLLESHAELIDSPATVHTMLRHYQIRKDQVKTIEAAKKLRQLLHQRGLTVVGGSSTEDQMLQAAIAVLGE